MRGVVSGNARLRAECLNAHLFPTLADAAEKLEAWRRDYNEVRPHGPIGNKRIMGESESSLKASAFEASRPASIAREQRSAHRRKRQSPESWRIPER